METQKKDVKNLLYSRRLLVMMTMIADDKQFFIAKSTPSF